MPGSVIVLGAGLVGVSVALSLRRRGYAARDIEKIMSGNWLRVLRDVWGE